MQFVERVYTAILTAQLLQLFRDIIKEEFNHCYTGSSGRIRRNGLEGLLEDVIGRLTMQLKLKKATLKSTSEEFKHCRIVSLLRNTTLFQAWMT